MKFILMPSGLEHLVGPKCLETSSRIEDLLENQPILRKALKDLETGRKVEYAELAPDGEGYLYLAHEEEYLFQVKSTCLRLKDRSVIPFDETGDTWLSHGSYQAACYAAGAAVRAAELAHHGTNAFALVRPPGHHAHSNHAGGFCIFNNIVIASEYLRRQREKVMIIDIDLHLGDGTIEYVDGKEEIRYFSIHHRQLWPATDFVKTATPENVDLIQLPDETDDVYYQHALKTLCLAIKQFSGETLGRGILAVSAGFDTYQDEYRYNIDKLNGGFQLTEYSYKFFKQILDESNLPYFLVLEGGYRPESLDAGLSVFTNELVQKEKDRKHPLILNPHGCFYACDG